MLHPLKEWSSPHPRGASLTANDEFPESLFVHRSKAHQEFFGPTNVVYELIGTYPSDKVLDLTSYGQFGYLHDTNGEHAGKILYYDVLRESSRGRSSPWALS